MTEKSHKPEIIPSPADDLARPVQDVRDSVKALYNATDEELAKINDVMMTGNFINLSERERTVFMYMRCLRMGLAPELQPFDWIQTEDRAGNTKLVPYAKKGAAEQLSARYKLSVSVIEKGVDADTGTYDVWVRCSGPDGRFVDNVGSVGVLGKGPKDAGNAKKSALTQATRRAILQYCGQGTLDESEASFNGQDGPKRIEPPKPYDSAVGGYSTQRTIPAAKPPESGELPEVKGPANLKIPVKIPVAKPKS